eukprot:GHVN01033602.1.p1 GENE.GHVN01033602.1~~GHVN01033602.1.p1  ORF type:complete len:190 (-),score=21.93 GHVN01033602.1:957-1526(-)
MSEETGEGSSSSSAPSNPTVDVQWEHDKQPSLTGPREVTYCSECGLPPDYCEFGPSWERCRSQALRDCPQFYAHISQDGDGDEEESDKKKKKQPKEPKKAPEQKVSIQRVARNKRKTTTVVTGLEHFGVKLDAATKLFSKQFACGSSVKTFPGLPDHIEIQGDVEPQVRALVVDHFQVPSEKVEILRPK